MAIYLVQHGQSLSKEQDPEKGLAEAGIADVQRIAQVAMQYRVPVSAIVHSGKKRASQTADIFAAVLKPAGGVHAISGIAPMDDVAAFANTLDMEKNEMVVGHLPFLERLISFLIIGQEQPPVFRMQNGGIVCLDHYPENKQVVIRWAIMPNVE